MLSLNFTPFPTIETARLLLRKLTMEDAPAFYFLRSDKTVIEYLNKAPDDSIDTTKLKIDEMLQLQENNETVLWAICLKDDPGTMIGYIGYWRMVKEHFRVEVGYTLHPGHWKKGLMKEALDAVLEYAFTKTAIHSIEANINPGNIASATLLESCGFVKEAYHKENYYYDGVFYDSVIYSKLAKLNDV